MTLAALNERGPELEGEMHAARKLLIALIMPVPGAAEALQTFLTAAREFEINRLLITEVIAQTPEQVPGSGFPVPSLKSAIPTPQSAIP